MTLLFLFSFFFTVDTCVMGLYCCFSVSPWLVVDEIKTFEITMFCHFENVNKLKRKVSEYLQIYWNIAVTEHFHRMPIHPNLLSHYVNEIMCVSESQHVSFTCIAREKLSMIYIGVKISSFSHFVWVSFFYGGGYFVCVCYFFLSCWRLICSRIRGPTVD